MANGILFHFSKAPQEVVTLNQGKAPQVSASKPVIMLPLSGLARARQHFSTTVIGGKLTEEDLIDPISNEWTSRPPHGLRQLL